MFKDLDCVRLVVLDLDLEAPLEHGVFKDALRYLKCFFGEEFDVEEVPATAATEKGWPSLPQRLHMPLRARPARLEAESTGDAAKWQLYVPQLISCLEALHAGSEAEHGVPVDGAQIILGLTAHDLFYDDSSIPLDEPVPHERAKTCFARSAKRPVGVLSVALLLAELEGARGSQTSLAAFRIFIRKLFKMASACAVDLLGLKKCQSSTCLAYVKPLDLAKTGFTLCAHCEHDLFKRMGWPAEYYLAARNAVKRYQDIGSFLQLMGTRLERIRIGHRYYNEFDEECDWFRMAGEILKEVAQERLAFHGPRGRESKRRSLLNCLLQVHQRQPPVAVEQRTFSSALVTRTCQVDMSQSAPFRHESGDLNNWASAVHNKSHKAGGFYVEMGGSLKGKTISNFVDAGLNASLIRREGILGDIKSMKKSLSAIQIPATVSPRKSRAPSSLVETDVKNAKRTGLVQSVERPLTRRRNARSLGYSARLRPQAPRR